MKKLRHGKIKLFQISFCWGQLRITTNKMILNLKYFYYYIKADSLFKKALLGARGSAGIRDPSGVQDPVGKGSCWSKGLCRIRALLVRDPAGVR